MAIAVRHQRGQRRIIVSISDALDAGAVPSLRRTLVRALRTKDPILIDVSRATSIHHDGLTTLVAAYRHAERAGTQLLLRTGPTQTRAVLAAFGVPPEDPR